MSLFRSSTIANLTRGGQVTVHFIRMIGQVTYKFIWVLLVIFLITGSTSFFYQTESYDRYLTTKWLMAKFTVQVLHQNNAVVPFRMPNNTERKVFASHLLTNPVIGTTVSTITTSALKALIHAIACTSILFLLLLRFIYRTGQGQGREHHLRGTSLVSKQELTKLVIKQGKIGPIEIADVPLPENAETSHMLFMGSPGTGKSQNIKALLKKVRQLKQRAIVYDVAGDYVRHFYNPEKDILLNPLDSRGQAWSLWAECQREHDYHQLAASLIPDGKQSDPFWAISARMVFASLAKKIAQEDKPSMKSLTNAIHRLSLDEMITFVNGTEAASLLSQGGDKMALSIRGMLAAHTRSLQYLKDGNDSFSIRNWISDENQEGWVFITSKPDQSSVLRPLITTWLDLAASGLMSLPPDRSRRLWLVMDELASLNRVPSLLDMLVQSRKYGGSAVIGFQSYPQLVDVYGINGAEAIAGACATWLILRCNENRSAEWASKALGLTELLETSEGISYGVNDMRDGVSLSKLKKTKHIVMPTEINQLRDLEGYLKLGRQFPIAKVMTPYRDYQEYNQGFIDLPVKLDNKVFTASNKVVDEQQDAEEGSGVERSQSKPQKVIYDEWTL